MDFKFQRRRLNEIPESKILEELEKVAKQFNYIEFAWREFDRASAMSANTVKKHFGSWKKGLLALREYLRTKNLDLKPRPFAPNRIYSDKQMFDEMERIWMKIGQRPSRYEWEMSSPSISYNAYKKRFGGWTNACTKFIEYKMGTNVLADDFVLPDKEIKPEDKTKSGRTDIRSVSLSLRLDVLSRDNFRCVYCGKSPATDIGTKLHIDHIVPFSQGGKSIFDNLQTLCEDCNLGKSDRNITIKQTHN